MPQTHYVTDTHSLVWYFTASPRLSPNALNAFEKTIKKGSIIVPAVVLAEIMYISKKGRIPVSFAETVKRIESSDNFEIVPLDLDILHIADTIESDLEMHDKIIVATAIFYNAPLISKDEMVKNSGACKVIW